MMPFDRFAYPWVLALLIAVPVVLFAAWVRTGRGRLVYPTTHLPVLAEPSVRARLVRLPTVLRAVALALFVVALARPQDELGLVRTSTEGVAIQIVLDRASSMLEQIELDGMKTNRLEAVKRVAQEFVAGNGDDLKGREGDMIGVVAFGSYADTICPLTREHSALLDLIGGIDVSPLRSEQGTAIGDSVSLAAAHLREAEKEIAAGLGDAEARPDLSIKSKAIILLTDGENNRGDIAPMEAAEACREWGITLYTIGIGGGSFVEIAGMRVPRGPAVDERTMRAMAARTGGEFWLADSAEALRDIYGVIDSLETTEIETSESVEYTERFVLFAVIGLALLVIEQLLAQLWLRRTL